MEKASCWKTMTKVLGGYASKCNNVLFKATKNDNEKGYILGTLSRHQIQLRIGAKRREISGLCDHPRRSPVERQCPLGRCTGLLPHDPQDEAQYGH